MRMQGLYCWWLLLAGLMVGTAQAGNTPCSGRKGGISHCAGGSFVCIDGSISASRRICGAGSGASGAGLAPTPAGPGSSCPCHSGRLCTGPRGGRYCLTPAGNNSYKPRK